MSRVRLANAVVLSLVLLVVFVTSTAAHRSGCHRWHSCPSDRGTYVCGDLGHCSQCPDNAYCQAGQPRPAAQQTPPAATPPPLTSPHPIEPQTARVVQIVDGDTIDVEIEGRRERVHYMGFFAQPPETVYSREIRLA